MHNDIVYIRGMRSSVLPKKTPTRTN